MSETRGIQFVFEKPQTNPHNVSKKRSRLITSCDGCRIKKIRCRPTGHDDGRCEACEASDSACAFAARDKVRSQRGIASFTVAPTRTSRKIIKPHQRTKAPFTDMEIIGGVLSSSLSFKLTPGAEFRTESLPSNTSRSKSRTTNRNSQGRHSETITLLFDPDRHNYPHPSLLSHFVASFLRYAGSVFPFFDPEETRRVVREGTLSPLLANCLAAYAARFSDGTPHISESLHRSGEPYLNVAKHLLLEPSNKLELLHANILIAWVESGSGRTLGFYTYGKNAVALAVELGLGSEEHICLEPCEVTRNRYRSTFWSVAWLEIMACSVNGMPCTLRIEECTTSMPYPEIEAYGSISRTILYRALKGVLILMISLNGFSNAGKAHSPSPLRDTGLRHIRHAIMTLQDGLPPSLAFTRENLSLTENLNESFVFYLVHALIHCFLVLVHCPSLFWVSQPPRTITEIPRLDIAWLSAMALVDILNTLRSENIVFANGLSSTFITLSIARGALLLAQSNREGALNASLMSVENFEFTSNFYLEQSLEMLQTLSRYWVNMLQVEISSELVTLCGVQTISRTLRDVSHDQNYLPEYHMTFDHGDEPKEQATIYEFWRAPLASFREAVAPNTRYLAWNDVEQTWPSL